MPYPPTDWVDGTTPLNAANLDKLEAGVETATALAEGSGGSSSAEYTYVDTATEPPNAGQVRMDNLDQTLATKLWIHDTTAPGVDVGNALRQIKAGEKLYLQDKNDASRWRVYDVTADAVDEVTYVEIAVAYEKGGDALLAQRVIVSVLRVSGGGGGADLSYDGDWVAGTYQDGDVVVKNGIAYLCVGGPTTVAPDIAPWGNAGLSLIGDELGYVEVASDVTVAAAAQAAAQTIFTFPAITFDGATPILLAVDFPLVSIPGGANYLIFNLWDGSTDLGTVLQIRGDMALGNYGSRRLTPSAGTHSYTVRGYGYGGAGQILSAPAGGRLPAYARMTRVVPSPPQFPVAPLTPPTYGTSLPASPTDGQEAILVDSVVNPTYQWRFRYNAGSTSPYKWEYVGGAAIISEILAGENTASATYVNGTTPGPSFTLPRAGDYEIGVGFAGQSSVAGQVGYMSYDIGATGAADADAAQIYGIGGGNPGGSFYRARKKTGLAAGAVLLAKYRSTNSTFYFSNRYLRVTPVRVA